MHLYRGIEKWKISLVQRAVADAQITIHVKVKTPVSCRLSSNWCSEAQQSPHCPRLVPKQVQQNIWTLCYFLACRCCVRSSHCSSFYCIILTFFGRECYHLFISYITNKSTRWDGVYFGFKRHWLLYQTVPVSNGSDSQSLWSLKSVLPQVLLWFDTKVSVF